MDGRDGLVSFSAEEAVFVRLLHRLLSKQSPGQQDYPGSQALSLLAEDLLFDLSYEGVAVRLNLLGQPGEQPDFVVAGWVLPYVYALRGDRDWRRSPQLTGSRQVSQLAVLVTNTSKPVSQQSLT